MLINREKIAQKVQSGEIASTEDLSLVLRGMIKEVVETAMGAELTAFLGYEKHRSPESDMGNRRNGYSLFSVFPSWCGEWCGDKKRGYGPSP